jgi:AhpD family alkylhydroperoxidase
MARIDGVPAERAGLLLRLVYWFARKKYGQLPEPGTIYAHHRGILLNTAIFELGNERVLRRLDPALRDLALHRVSTQIGCSWCVDFGTMLSIRQGLSVERHRELDRYADSDAFSPVEKLAIAYADAMTAEPMQVTDELVAELRRHLDDPELVELTYVIALENQRSRFNHALGITAQGFTSADACPVPQPVTVGRLKTQGGSASRG